MKKIISLGKFIIEKKEFRNLIKDSYKIYIKAENSIKKRIELFSYSKEISFMSTEGNFLESYKKNFFTFLMISILKHSKIEEDRLVKYGEIIICLRTIITCTDNIIDNEKKGLVFLNSIKNTIVNNTLLLMTFQNILTNISKELTTEIDSINFILDKIHFVAKSEGLRDRNLYDSYPNSDFLIKEIHSGIGGELLNLSLWFPSILEKDFNKNYMEALFEIGMSLQALDDLCDMQEDYEAGKVNLGISILLEKDSSLNDFTDLEKSYPDFFKIYLNDCIHRALKGFEILENLNYPINKDLSFFILKHLFKLRGLEKYWNFNKI